MTHGTVEVQLSLQEPVHPWGTVHIVQCIPIKTKVLQLRHESQFIWTFELYMEHTSSALIGGGAVSSC